MRFPEVDRVLGKAGRAETSTDPAPLSMMETVDHAQAAVANGGKRDTWYDVVGAGWMQAASAGTSRRTTSPPTNWSTRWTRRCTVPGVSNAWTMPIKNRIDMLTTGMRTPVGIKIYGADLRDDRADRHADRAAAAAQCRARAACSPSARAAATSWTSTGSATQLAPLRPEHRRCADGAWMNAIGGENVTTTVEGRERYPVNVRYMRDFRSDLDRCSACWCRLEGKQQIPLAELARFSSPAARRCCAMRTACSPAMCTSMSPAAISASYVDEADAACCATRLKLPAGYSIAWSGQYEAMERVQAAAEARACR